MAYDTACAVLCNEHYPPRPLSTSLTRKERASPEKLPEDAPD